MKEKFYMSLGIWIALLPFLGIPHEWRNGLLAASGILLASISLGPILFEQVKPVQKVAKKRIAKNTSPIVPVSQISEIPVPVQPTPTRKPFISIDKAFDAKEVIREVMKPVTRRREKVLK